MRGQSRTIVCTSDKWAVLWIVGCSVGEIVSWQRKSWKLGVVCLKGTKTEARTGCVSAVNYYVWCLLLYKAFFWKMDTIAWKWKLILRSLLIVDASITAVQGDKGVILAAIELPCHWSLSIVRRVSHQARWEADEYPFFLSLILTMSTVSCHPLTTLSYTFYCYLE